MVKSEEIHLQKSIISDTFKESTSTNKAID